MSRLPIASVILAVLVCSSVGKAQSVQVSPQNRTIEIAANSSIEVTADQVTITVGYHNYGSTHDAAFAEEEDLKNMTPAERREKQFEVDQSWRVTQNIEVAAKLLDIAVNSGANDVSDPEWSLADPDAADARAYASALEKARATAEQMAKSFGGKVGALLYASNESKPSHFTSMETVEVTGVVEKNHSARPDTKLLPQKIEKTGYVRAIFALE